MHKKIEEKVYNNGLGPWLQVESNKILGKWLKKKYQK